MAKEGFLLEQSQALALWKPEVERALIGSLVLKPDMVAHVSDYLHAEHFFDPLHNLIFATIIGLQREQRASDIVSLTASLDNYGLFEDAGGKRYIAGIMDTATTLPDQIKNYAEMVVDYATRRVLVDAAREVIDKCVAPLGEYTASQIVDEHETALLKINQTNETQGGLVPFRVMLDATYAAWKHEAGGTRGVPTGFTDLDRLLGGLHPTDMICLAGASSMGKTAMGTCLAFNAAMFFRTTDDLEHRKKVVAFFSLEMSMEQLGSRIVTGETKIIAPRNRWGHAISEEEWADVIKLATDYGDLPFWVDDSPNMTLTRIRSRAIRLHRRKPIGLIVIDYLQLLSSETKGEKDIERISQISRGLKLLAMELKVPIIALSQLSRAPSGRDNPRPQLSDLRGSGTIENDSDVVIFTYRHEYYLRQQGRPVRKINETLESWQNRVAQFDKGIAESESKCEIIVGKQRHGPLGTVELYFNNTLTRFENLQKGPAPDDPQGSLLTPADHQPFGGMS